MADVSAFTKEENDLINERFQELLQDYLNSNHRKKVELITKAFQFANRAHAGTRRRSGEPYMLHPIAVARICCAEIGLGSTSICCALLHDVVEDTDYTVEDISNSFGPKIASIVEGLTKISGGIFGETTSIQAENFRKLLLTMSEDIRVVLIKMADRLHNMRTLEFMRENKRHKITGETMYIYAPLANRLGLNRIKTELENLCFKYDHPDRYAELDQKLKSTAATRLELYNNFIAPIRKELDSMGIEYYMKARTKSIYSIWNKMQSQNVSFDDIYDILAVRIIFETKTEKNSPNVFREERDRCWAIFAAITQIYEHHPNRIRDWVSRPKPNGYQALHLTAMGPDGIWIEVQIRSERMDEIAERGLAAHWKYKNGEATEEGELNRLIDTVKDILENPEPNAIDFLNALNMNLLSSEIFLFTPKGEMKTLPTNSTALDFAFALHTEIGFHCIGAKVNHKLVPMSHVLRSGDQVEILTSQNQTVSPEWLNWMTSASAKNRVLAKFRKENRELLMKGINLLGIFLADNRIPNDGNTLDALITRFNTDNKEDLYVRIGLGVIQLDEDASNYLMTALSGHKRSGRKKLNRKETYVVDLDSLEYRFVLAKCCHPIPGDDALGVVEKDEKSITVHKRQCPVAMKIRTGYGSRIVSVSWEQNKVHFYPVTLELSGIDQVGIVSQVAKIVSDEESINMTRLLFETKDGIFSGQIDLNIHDLEDLNNLCMKIAQIANVEVVRRIERTTL